MTSETATDDCPKLEGKNTSADDNQLSNKDDSAYELTGIPLALVIIGLGLSIFLIALDSSIISTAIPRITSEFHSTNDIAWYGSAYSFAMCALQPMAGKVFSNFSMKWSYIACLGILEVGSLLCALAVNSPMLIVGRAIAGIGAAGCFTGAFCILAVGVPFEKRPVYVGILQSTSGIAMILGPIIGGALTQHATWRWCFWINLPLGAVTILTIILFFKPPSKDSPEHQSILDKLKSLDILGFLAFAPAIIMILLALQWGGTSFAWKSATIIGLFVGGALLLVLFALWQVRKGDSAMIPPRLIVERTMFFACTSELFAMGAVYISIYYLPEWFQVIKGASSTESGIMYLPLALSDVFAAISTGLSLKYVGYVNPYIILGTALMSIGTGLFSTFTTSTPHTHWIPFQVLQGLGAGMTLSMPYVATQAVLEPEDIPVGTSILQCFQFFGASVLLAVAGSIFDNKLVSRLGSMGFGEKEIQTILNAGSAEVRSVVPKSQLSAALTASNYALTRTFYVAAGVAAVALCISLGIQWRSVIPPKVKTDPSGVKGEE